MVLFQVVVIDITIDKKKTITIHVGRLSICNTILSFLS